MTMDIWKKIGKQIREQIEKQVLVLLDKWQKSKAKPVLPDVPDIITPPAPIIVKPVGARGCQCARMRPISVPPYTDLSLKAAGNSEECPATKAGAGVVRLAVVAGIGKSWLIGHLLDQGYDIDTFGNIRGKCFAADGGQYHFIGYDHHQDPNNIIKIEPGVWFPYSWVTFIWFEFSRG
jgi:hypothetical protein